MLYTICLTDILETADLLGFITAQCFEKWVCFHLQVEMSGILVWWAN